MRGMGRMGAVALCVAVLAGCTGADAKDAQPTSTTVAPGTVTGDVTGTVAVAYTDALDAPAAGLDGVTPIAAPVEITGGKVTGDAELRLPLTAEIQDGAVVFALTAESKDGPWEILPAEVDGDSVVIHTTHFSLFGAFQSLLSGIGDVFKATLEGITAQVTATAKPPSCDDEDGARSDGYSVSSDSGDTVFWCFGKDANGRYLRIVNNRRYALLVSYGNGVTDVQLDDLDVELSHMLANVFTIGNEATISPRASATFRLNLAAGSEVRFKTELDGVGSALAQLEYGADTLVTILGRFGGGAPAGSPEARSKLVKLLEDKSCIEAVGTGNAGEVIAGCFDYSLLAAVFGTAAAVILSPIIAAGSLLSFFRTKLNEAGDIINHRDRYTVSVARGAAAPPAPSPPNGPPDVCGAEALGDLNWALWNGWYVNQGPDNDDRNVGYLQYAGAVMESGRSGPGGYWLRVGTQFDAGTVLLRMWDPASGLAAFEYLPSRHDGDYIGVAVVADYKHLIGSADLHEGQAASPELAALDKYLNRPAQPLHVTFTPDDGYILLDCE